MTLFLGSILLRSNVEIMAMARGQMGKHCEDMDTWS